MSDDGGGCERDRRHHGNSLEAAHVLVAAFNGLNSNLTSTGGNLGRCSAQGGGVRLFASSTRDGRSP